MAQPINPDRTDEQRTYHREWVRARRAEFFDGKSCVKCGSRKSLELDHIDPATKVSHKIWSWSAKRRAAEIAKCQVLCTDCHKVKTFSERRSYEGEANPGCRWSDEDVARIVALREGGMVFREIGDVMGASTSAVHKVYITRGKRLRAA